MSVPLPLHQIAHEKRPADRSVGRLPAMHAHRHHIGNISSNLLILQIHVSLYLPA
jgi:hypothetical protein